MVVRLPDGRKIVVNNVYLPPCSSLSQRGIREQDAYDAVLEVLTKAPAAADVITMGDFNARTGTLAPRVGDVQLRRTSMDATV